MCSEMANDIFKIHPPDNADHSGMLVVNCPHSGQDYAMFDVEKITCSFEQLRVLEDSLMDEMAQLSRLGQYGITALQALFPRSYIDPNRAVTSLDKTQIRQWTGQYINYFIPDKYTSLGAGLVPVKAKPEGFDIYEPDNYPTEEDIAGRLKYYKAYHAQLQEILRESFNKFGGYALLDMHSCHPTGPADENGDRPRRADIILSDCRGQSCSAEFLEVVRQAYIAQGFENVEVNRPFKGGFITSHYGRGGMGIFSAGQVAPSRAGDTINALQIEVNKRLYWDFETGREKPDSAPLKAANIAVFRKVHDYSLSLV